MSRFAPVNSVKNAPLTERGRTSSFDMTFECDDDTEKSFLIDTINQGAISLVVCVDNTNGTQDLTVDIKGMSREGVSEVSLAGLDETGAAIASGGFAVGAGDVEYFFLSYSDFPQTACFRHYKVYVSADAAPAAPFNSKVYVDLK